MRPTGLSRAIPTKAASAAARAVTALWRDTDGIMVPYVAVMLPVLVGFATLALDASRRMSLQTQMQAAADSLALAGARELNRESGAEARAVSAMASAYAETQSANTLAGVGSPPPALAYTYVFYSALAPAAEGIGGTAASDDLDAKYVAVRITPQTFPTIFPVSFVSAGAKNTFTAGAEAAAGFAGTSVCSAAPMFICNPYEAADGSMTDAQATAALLAAFSDPATLRRQLKLNRNGIGPGHFGWLKTADGCSGLSCMAKNLASVSGACYNDVGVNLALANKAAGEPYLDTRFDIYNQSPPLAASSENAPALNVRKGYLPGNKSGAVDWCTAKAAGASNAFYAYPSARTTGTATQNSASLTGVGDATAVSAGEPLIDAANVFASSADNPISVASASGATITASAPASELDSSDALTIEWTASGLPEDVAFPALAGAEGNGQWDCADYWAISHPHGPSASTVGSALGGVCGTPAQTTVSRYRVYRYEIALGAGPGGAGDWSGHNGWSSNGRSDMQGASTPTGRFQTESGAPYCASSKGVSGVDTTTGGVDRRNLVTPIVNCLAQSALGAIGGGESDNVPVAAFGKFFLTQPYTALNDGNLYGEMTGLVVPADNVRIYNLVQLYR